MPWYFFVVQWPDGRLDNVGTTNLPDDASARRYAKLLAQELKEKPEYRDPELKLIVRNSASDVIHIMPL